MNGVGTLGGEMVDPRLIFGFIPFASYSWSRTIMNDRTRFKNAVGADWCALIHFWDVRNLGHKKFA
jgi:hypothetical protein